ncbi:MAG: cytochrome c biogenesis protein CcdA [Spirulinaceae cyanobacterium SM2_1_0]|nr:cytochrome c biogenesis protein CcdA [Spirulinaceae cyanobacterium SM2_1_0]
MLDALQGQLYALSQWADRMAAAELDHLSLLSLAIVFATGLLTSLTPCMLSMLPISIAYIGSGEVSDRWQAARQSTWFALGLATTLALLGIAAALLGRVYGQIGVGLPIVVSAIAILMGLNLLGILPLRLPASGDATWIPQNWPLGLRAYTIGVTFGLVASPCSTPVLATLLAWVGASQNLTLGGALLFAYALGYVLPLAIAGTFTALLKQFLELRRWSAWITPASGAILVGFGVFSLLSRLPSRWF